MCGKELAEAEAVPVYKEVLDRESGEWKQLSITLYKSCYAIVKKRSI